MSDSVVWARSHQTILDCFDDNQPPNPLALSLSQLAETGVTTTALASRRHIGRHLTVLSQLSVGIDQRLRIGWVVPNPMFDEGYRLLGFRSTNGFAPSPKVENLALHGQKIIDATHCDVRDELVTPGEYFYTFILQKNGWLLVHDADVIQFSERVPSGEQVIARLRETIEGQKLVQELLRINGVKNRIENHGTGHAPLTGRAIAELLAEQNREITYLRESEAFKLLSAKEQEHVIATLKHQYKQRMEGR